VHRRTLSLHLRLRHRVRVRQRRLVLAFPSHWLFAGPVLRLKLVGLVGGEGRIRGLHHSHPVLCHLTNDFRLRRLLYLSQRRVAISMSVFHFHPAYSTR